MSSDAIYIESVIVEFRANGNSVSCTVTDFEHTGREDSMSDAKLRTFQGPLSPSQYTSLGTFGELLETMARRTGHRDWAWETAGVPFLVTITILADYASEALLVGAQRTFNARWTGDRLELIGEKPSTEQIRSPRKRRRLYDTLVAMEGC